MPHPDEPALIAYVADYPSATALAVYGSSDPAAAGAALRAAAEKICEIRHPDEPDAALPNWCEVVDEDGVPVLHLDMKDEVRYAGLVVRIVLDRLAGSGVDGRLEPRREPEPAVPYDADADRYSGMRPLTALDGRGLPPGFPDGFPVPPDATLVLAQQCPDGCADHAVWRRSGEPFTGYLARLRGYGCAFGPVPRLLTAGQAPDIVRYTLWRDGAGGQVTLYRSAPGTPPYWYASVVWQPRAEPPATVVEPDEAPDDRPLPTGPGAARELAEFLVPPQLVAGYETVVALATAARAVEQLLRAGGGAGRRAGPAVAASRLAPLFGRLSPEQVDMLRHVCLALVANVLAHGGHARPAGLTLLRDDRGHLYAADFREQARGAVDERLVATLETGVALTRGVPMMTGALAGIRTAPVRPAADRYAWLFAGLDSAELVAARDACWGLFGA